MHGTLLLHGAHMRLINVRVFTHQRQLNYASLLLIAAIRAAVRALYCDVAMNCQFTPAQTHASGANNAWWAHDANQPCSLATFLNPFYNTSYQYSHSEHVCGSKNVRLSQSESGRAWLRRVAPLVIWTSRFFLCASAACDWRRKLHPWFESSCFFSPDVIRPALLSFAKESHSNTTAKHKTLILYRSAGCKVVENSVHLHDCVSEVIIQRIKIWKGQMYYRFSRPFSSPLHSISSIFNSISSGEAYCVQI